MSGTTDTPAKPHPEDAELTIESNDDDEAAEEAVTNARALALRDSMIPRLHTGEPAYKQFSKEMLALVAKTIMPENYTVPELYMGLEIAATYGLDPFTRELWLIRMKNGGPVVPLVGRDGFLAIAERHKDYKGFRNAEVYEKDTFSYDADPRELPDGSFTHVRHSFDVTSDRGELKGAWAEVYRSGKPPVFFFAPIAEYDKTGDSYSPWKKQRTAMIRKCALANALRLAFRISGLYVGDEVSGAAIEMQPREVNAAGEVKPLHEDPEWAARFDVLFRTRNDITPGTYYPGKQRVLIEGCADVDELRLLAARIEDEIVAAGGIVPSLEGVDAEEVLEADEIDEPEQTTLT